METDAGSTPDTRSQQLATLERGTTTAAALAFFDALPPVGLAGMIGSWRGRGVPTGNPLDGMLERFGWQGKRFDSVDDVHPLVFEDGKGALFNVNPARVPMGLIVRVPSLANTPVAAHLFRLLRPLLRTRKPAARMHMVEYRGVVSATMIYDALPVIDAFREVDEHTLLGVMDLRGLDQPFVFRLHRVA